MQTIVISNRKGGVGKTALAVNVAAAWAQGQDTLLIDMDPQADASLWLDVPDTGERLAEALLGNIGLQHAVHRTEWGINVAAAGEALGRVREKIRPDSLRGALASLEQEYSRVVIDCPPGLSGLVLAGWRASRDPLVVVPVDGPEALRAVRRLGHAWEDAGLDLNRIRVVLTRFDARRVLDRALAEDARSLEFGSVLESTVRETVVVGDAASWRKPLVDHAPRHAVTDDFRNVAREVSRG